MEHIEDKIGSLLTGRKCPSREAVIRKYKLKHELPPEDREDERVFLTSWGLNPDDWFIKKKSKNRTVVKNAVTGEIRTITEGFERK